MKKIKYLAFTIVLIICLILSSKLTSKATFYINNFDIRAEVKQNGDMEVTESIQYYSDETKNGVTREIKTKNEYNSKNSADSLALEEVLVDNYKARQVYSGTLGEDGVYEYNKSGDNHSLKVYMPMSISNPNRTVTYKYTLTNVAVKYKDIAEIFWNFIGKEWDTEIKKVHIRVILPYEATYDSIYVYGHGSDNGRFEKNNNIIDLYATDLDAYQALDARILFSKTAIPQSIKEIDKSVLNKYINEEEGITKEYEQAEVLAGLTINEIAIGLSAVIILTGIYLYFKFDKEYKVEKHHYYREIPHNLTPEILQTVYYGKVQKNAFFITFLNLIKKGVYTITKTQNEIGKETQLITYNEDSNQTLEDYEDEVKKRINTFFDKSENSIDTLKLQQKMKYSSKMYYRDYIRKLESRKEGLFGEKQKLNKKVTKYLTIAMVALILFMVFIAFWAEPGIAFGLLMFLAITTLVYTVAFKSIEPNAFTIGFFTIHCGAFQIANIAMLVQCGEGIMYIPYALLFILLQYAYRIERTSIEERQIREEIKGLRRYIKEYSYLSTKEKIQEISLWEDYFIMAIALGLNENVVNYFYDYCKENINDDFGNSLIAFSSYGIMSTTMASSFISYANRASVVSSSRGGSSYSGSSGGFSGGSSSGGGGRRGRRRKFILKRQYANSKGEYAMKKQNIKRKHEDVLHVYEEDFKVTKTEKKKNWIDKICAIAEKIGISIMNLGIAIIALTFIGVVAWWASMGESRNPSVKKTLKDRYGQSFVIVSKDVDKKGNGTYIVYPRGYKEYKFVVTKNKRSIKEDYKNMVIKTYWSNISDKQKEEMKLVQAENRMDIKIEEYNQMEVVLAQYYNLYKKSQKELPGNITLNTQLKLGDYTGYISVKDKETMENYIIRMKYNYINSLINQNKDTSHIPQDEIESIWTPEELTLIVNGTVIKKEESFARYLIDEKEYMVTYLKPLTKYINNFEFIGTTWFGMGNQKFRYKDKKFTLNYIVTETKLKEYLNANIKIDIENRTMELNFGKRGPSHFPKI